MRNLALVVIAVVAPLLASAETIELPFKQDRRLGVLRVEVKVNGKAAVLLVDTGASRSILGADRVGMPGQLLPASVVRPAPGVRISGLSGMANITLGRRTWRDWTVVVVDLSGFRAVYGDDIGGIIGQDFLGEFESVEIDYRNKIIRLRD